MASKVDRDLRRQRNLRVERLKRRKIRLLNKAFSDFEKKKEAGQIASPPQFLGEVVSRVTKLTPDLLLHLKEYKQNVFKVHWAVFEHIIAEFFASRGYDDVRLVGRETGTSADIYAAHTHDPSGVKLRFFIEVKHEKEKIGINVINSVLGAMMMERAAIGWHAAMIVTSGGFREVKKFSKLQLSLLGLELRDKTDLFRWLDDYKPNKDRLWLPNPKRKVPALIDPRTEQPISKI